MNGSTRISSGSSRGFGIIELLIATVVIAGMICLYVGVQTRKPSVEPGVEAALQEQGLQTSKPLTAVRRSHEVAGDFNQKVKETDQAVADIDQ